MCSHVALLTYRWTRIGQFILSSFWIGASGLQELGYPLYIDVYIHACTRTCTHTLSVCLYVCTYVPALGCMYAWCMHAWNGRMYPNYWQITTLLVVDLCSSSAYFMITQPLAIAGKLPIKTLVAKQLPTHTYAHTHTHVHPRRTPTGSTCIHTYRQTYCSTATVNKTHCNHWKKSSTTTFETSLLYTSTIHLLIVLHALNKNIIFSISTYFLVYVIGHIYSL